MPRTLVMVAPDIFDEQGILDVGRQAGRTDGRMAGRAKGHDLGVAEGRRLGASLAGMLTDCMSVDADLARQILSFPLTNDEDGEKERTFNRLSSRHKLVMSKKGKTVSEKSLSF